jgi:hypothetical protein
MSEFGPVDILEWLDSLPRTASGDERHHEAILASLLGYLLFRERNDWRYEKASLICLQSAVEGRLKEFGDQPVQSGGDQKACSFCLRGQPEVRLAAGPDCFICDVCVATLSEVFGAKSA